MLHLQVRHHGAVYPVSWVFAALPFAAARGALLAMGGDYYLIGRATGDLAARVLGGEDMSRIPILYRLPKLLVINRTAGGGDARGWRSRKMLTYKDLSSISRGLAGKGGHRGGGGIVSMKLKAGEGPGFARAIDEDVIPMMRKFTGFSDEIASVRRGSFLWAGSTRHFFGHGQHVRRKCPDIFQRSPPGRAGGRAGAGRGCRPTTTGSARFRPACRSRAKCSRRSAPTVPPGGAAHRSARCLRMHGTGASVMMRPSRYPRSARAPGRPTSFRGLC